MYANENYAGCGCTSLATYAGPRFVTAPAYGANPAPSKGLTRTQKVIVTFACFAAIYGIHRASGGYDVPPPSRASRGTVTPRKYHHPR